MAEKEGQGGEERRRKGRGRKREWRERGLCPHYKTSCGRQCTYVTPVGNKKKMEGKRTSKEREAERSDGLDFVSLT